MSIITEEMRRVCRQHSRQEYIRVTILNNQNLEIAQIEGKTIEGNISIDNSSYLRRSATLKLILSSELLPKQQSLIWTNKKCKIEIGVLDLLSDKIVWFSMGIYLYKSTQMSYSVTEKSLSLTLLDLMAKFSGDINGTLENGIKIANQGVSISQAIRSLVTQIGGENPNNVLIEDIVDDNGNLRLLPYTLSKQAGDKMLDALKELVELYKYQTCYYNREGVFVAERTKVLLSDPITEDFKNDIDFTISSQVQNSYDYIKNYVKVLGISVQPMVSVEDIQGIDNQNPINNSSGLKIIFNKPLYNSTGNRIANGANLKDYFEYSGTASKYVSATYDATLWTVTFSIQGENGKILKPKNNMIFDSTQISYNDEYVYSNSDGKWSRILVATVITDGVNNQTQFQLNFNKALYKNGNPITSGTSLKSSFYYADGTGNTNNFIDAIYTIDNNNYYITLSFNSAVINATIQVNKDEVNNTNSLYDSASLIYRTETYIMDGTTWTMLQNDSNQPTYQIWSELSNTDDTSPYSINNLGEKRSLIINDSNIYTKSQADLKCQWELQTHSNLNETINLTCLALYYLDTNMLICLYNKDLGIDGKYRIDKVNFDLKNGMMNLSCSKLYM